MTILITGAGLVGSHVGRELKAHGEELIYFDCDPTVASRSSGFDPATDRLIVGDITDLAALTHVVRQEQVSTIVHTAALIGAKVSNDPKRGVEVNVDGAMNVLEAARLAGVSRLIFASSVAIYDLARLPEHAVVTEESPVGPKNLYGATKLAAEHLLTQYGKLYGIEIVHLRMAGVFGRGHYKGGSWMGLVLNRLLEAALKGQPYILQPEWIGTQEYVYVKDVAVDFRLACLKAGPLSGAFNIGTGMLHSYSEVVAEIKELLPGAEIEIAEASGPIASYLARTQAFDISKARRELAFAPQFTFQAGIQDYLAELRQLVSPVL